MLVTSTKVSSTPSISLFPFPAGRGEGEGGERVGLVATHLIRPSRSLSSGRASHGPVGDGPLLLPPEARREACPLGGASGHWAASPCGAPPTAPRAGFRGRSAASACRAGRRRRWRARC